MFLKYILGRSKNELVSKVFWAQVASPEKGDWATTVGEDLKDFGVNQTFSEIQDCGDNTFKEYIKERMKETSLEYLNQIKEQKSKMRNLNYNELKTQDYLQDAKIPLRLKKLLFLLRCRMVRVAGNYGKPTELCPLGCGQLDTQENLLQCLSIKMSSFDVMTNKGCQYSDIFTNDPEKMKAATLLFDKAIRTREVLLEAK